MRSAAPRPNVSYRSGRPPRPGPSRAERIGPSAGGLFIEQQVPRQGGIELTSEGNNPFGLVFPKEAIP
jgi:hypothetical protein